MNNNKEDIKEKNLKQIGIIVSLIILLTLIGYTIFPDREDHQKEQKEEVFHINLLVGFSICMEKIIVIIYMKDVI